MKKSEIKIGSYYTNGKGAFRKVTEFVIDDYYDDRDHLEYVAWGTGKSGVVPRVGNRYVPGRGSVPSSEYTCTRTSFASWAKRKATATEIKIIEALAE